MEVPASSSRYANYTRNKDKLHKVFVYGTLKNGQPNHFQLDDPDHGAIKFYGNACTTTEYPLVIATKWNLPFMLHAPGEGQKVKGELYFVDDEMLAWLDDFEGHPDVYERLKLRVRVGRGPGERDYEEVECMSYFLTKFPEPLRELHTYAAYDAMADEDRMYNPADDFSDDDDIDEALEEECERIESEKFWDSSSFEEECIKRHDSDLRGAANMYHDIYREGTQR